MLHPPPVIWVSGQRHRQSIQDAVGMARHSEGTPTHPVALLARSPGRLDSAERRTINREAAMKRVTLRVEGDVREAWHVLRRMAGALPRNGSPEKPTGPESPTNPEGATATDVSWRSTAGWTLALATEFAQSLDPSIRRLVLAVNRSDERNGPGTAPPMAGTLCRRGAQPAHPVEPRPGAVPERPGGALSRPVYSDLKIKLSIIDPGLAQVASLDTFDAGRLSRGGRGHDPNVG